MAHWGRGTNTGSPQGRRHLAMAGPGPAPAMGHEASSIKHQVSSF